MATATAKYGVGLASGPISFSALRETFLLANERTTFGGAETFDPTVDGNGDPVPVSASQLVRNTTADDPNVPDATENQAISASQSNLKASQFRNTIKYYYIGQTGTDLNYNIGSQSWNNNLPLSIVKRAFIDGTCGSNTSALAAARLVNVSKNITIDVEGGIYGGAGQNGVRGNGATVYPNPGTPSTGGNAGGIALNVNASANNVVVFVRSINANLFGGGGGGAGGGGGGHGGTGGTGLVSTTVYNSVPICTCPVVSPYGCTNSIPGCITTASPCAEGGMRWFCPTTTNTFTAGAAGGDGGPGGNGGRGRGYNLANTFGGSGTPGTAGGPSPGGNAGAGGDGGDGGDGGPGGTWGTPGSPTNTTTNAGEPGEDGDPGNYAPGPATAGSAGGNGAAGGAGGASMSGANYEFTGTINTSGSNITIRGPIVGGTQV
tara:strand:+ start:2723 stop:4021 length:1299 start_codon:yes stop_codon:yes gene_type:complete